MFKIAEYSVKEIVNYLEKQLRLNGLNVSKIIVFGSHARHEAREDSDIDIAVVSDAFAQKDIFQRVEMVRNAEIKTLRRFMIPLDIVLLSAEEFEQERSMIVLYAKQGQIVFAS